jgi:cardiolipin synthase
MITCLRFVLIPGIVFAIVYEQWIQAIGLFIIASLTDMCDGLIARLYNQHTFLGAWLDPVADKVLMIATFCALSYSGQGAFVIPYWFLVLLIVKELILIIGALVLYGYCNAAVISPTMLGKATTCIQVLFVSSLSCMHIWHMYSDFYMHVLFILLIFVIALSFIQYLWYGISFFYNNKKDNGL